MRPSQENDRLLLRPQEAADALGVSLRTVMGWVQAGEIPVTRLGERNLRFPLDGLREWVAQRTTWPTAMVPLGPEETGNSPGNSPTGPRRDANGAAKEGRADV